MRRVWQYILLAGMAAGTLSANGVLSCSFNNGPFTTSGCYTSPSFSVIESFDWQTALGPANQGPYNPILNGAWTYTTPDDLTVGLTLGPNFAGSNNELLRVDNFYRYFDSGSGMWKAYNAPFSPYAGYNSFQGMFDAPPDGGAGSPGEHLIHANGNPLEIQFSRGISDIMFRISTPTSSDVQATLAAYAVMNPTASDVPIAV